jgi:hypothetical protein
MICIAIEPRMVEEAERRQAEAERLRQEVMQAREAEKEAKNKLVGKHHFSLFLVALQCFLKSIS